MAASLSFAIQHHIAPLQSHAVRLTGSREDAKDLLQDTLLRALMAPSASPAVENTRAWLFAVMRNQWFNTVRHNKVVEYIPETCSDEAIDPWTHDSEATAQRDIRQALAALPPRCQEAILAHLDEEGSPGQAAARLGVSSVTVRARMDEARRRLRKCLDLRDFSVA